MFHAKERGSAMVGIGRVKASPRRNEVLAIIIERIARDRISPTFDEIGLAMCPRVGQARARQLVEQLVQRGEIRRLPGKQRGLVVMDMPNSRAILAEVCSRLGWPAGAAPVVQQPYPNAQLPRLPEIRYLPDA